MNPLRKAVIGTVLVGSTVLGGAVGATLVGSAGAAETTTSSTAPAASSTAPAAPDQTSGQPPQGAPRGPHQANGITEALLTGDSKTKAEAAATAAVPGGTVERSETDAEGAAYEVHMHKSDGSEVTVKLDKDFTVTSIEQGRA